MAEMFDVDVTATVKDFNHFLSHIESRIHKKNIHFAGLLTTRVKVKASGRPGPNAPTGDYRGKIDAGEVITADSIGFAVGTDDIRGRRLEMGFDGVDSLGRVYDQPPYPHFGPALDEITADYVQGIADCVDEASP